MKFRDSVSKSICICSLICRATIFKRDIKAPEVDGMESKHTREGYCSNIFSIGASFMFDVHFEVKDVVKLPGKKKSSTSGTVFLLARHLFPFESYCTALYI